MRQKLLLTFLLCISSHSLIAQKIAISKTDALEIAQRAFFEKDVDFFVLEDDSTTDWTIFVDAEPIKGWEHDCYLLTIPKLTTVPAKKLTPTNITKRNLPPEKDGFVPLLLQNRYDEINLKKQIVPKRNVSPTNQQTANRTFAIILSGGVDKISNAERYWNDCSFIYQTLVNKYGVPKENIHALIADGDNPAEDHIAYKSGKFEDQSLDLDFDGEDEISLSATKQNVINTINSIYPKLKKDDQLFIYVIDHGGTEDGNSYICLWREANTPSDDYIKLFDYELASLLNPILSKGVIVNTVFGQCFSGGFIDDLEDIGCVIATACNSNEYSWGCSRIPYDEFVYHWTCAVNEAKHYGDPIRADIDKDGLVSMMEAFKYAQSNDTRNEHPQYSSSPVSLGDDLALNHIPESVDLYIKDDVNDTGKQPNRTASNFWTSPSICVRNQNDNIFVHENPKYSSTSKNSYVYVRVHNRGKEKFNGNNKWVALYWAEASTGISTKTWKGKEYSNDGHITGGLVGFGKIPEILPDEYSDVVIEWKFPEFLSNYSDDNLHFCLLAKIMDSDVDDGYEEGKKYFDVEGSNNQAQKNVTIINTHDLEKSFRILVRNIESVETSYSLELAPRTIEDESIFKDSEISMQMGPIITEAWRRGGSQSKDLELTTIDNSNSTQSVSFIAPKGKLLNLTMPENECDAILLKFDFPTTSKKSGKYTLDLIQKDIDGNTIGGETFEISRLVFSGIPFEPIIEVDPIPATELQYKLMVRNSGFKSYRWQNSNEELIGESNSVIVTPSYKNMKFSVSAITEEDEIVVSDIDLTTILGIEKIIEHTDHIDVVLKGSAPQNATIEIISVRDRNLKSFQVIPTNSVNVAIDTYNFQSGHYIICYKINSELLDQRKIWIE